MSNHYNIFALRSQYRISFSSANCFFWKKIYWSDITVLLTLSRLTYNAFIAVGCTFGVLTPNPSRPLLAVPNVTAHPSSDQRPVYQLRIIQCGSIKLPFESKGLKIISATDIPLSAKCLPESNMYECALFLRYFLYLII